MTIPASTPAPPELNGRHLHTYEAIFRHPAPHNLEWHDVRSLIGALAEVKEETNGSIHASRNGHSLFIHTPKHKDVPLEEIKAIRHFLEQSDTLKAAQPETGIHLLVLVDHHEAKIFRTDIHGTVPQKLVPYDTHGYGRHLRSDTEETDGKRKPERKSYYEAIAASLHGADRVLIFGSGTGESSAMDHLIAELKQNHADVVKHITGSVVVDAHHLSEGQLLAKAREFYSPSGS